MSDLDANTQVWLEQFLGAQGAVAGTVHTLDTATDTLIMRAFVNIPEPVRAVTFHIPRGKGMAGLALVRERPVSTCNLQDDGSGDVRPGAKAVNAQAAVAVPVSGPAGVRAVVGLAWADQREFTDAALAALMDGAATLPQ